MIENPASGSHSPSPKKKLNKEPVGGKRNEDVSEAKMPANVPSLGSDKETWR